MSNINSGKNHNYMEDIKVMVKIKTEKKKRKDQQKNNDNMQDV